MSGTNWNNPVLTSTYSAMLNELNARDVSAMTQMRSSLASDTNIPTSAIRWNDTTFKWESWNGTAWSNLASIYAIGISGNAATATDASQLGGIAAGNYAQLNSPTFTGLPVLPTGTVGVTQAATDNSTKLATTGFVQALKDITGGFVGLTLFKINFKNAANTFTSFFTNSNTAARTYTFPDKDGTVAMTVDITDHTGLATGAHAATAISSVASGNLSATNVGAALNELQSDIDTRVLSSAKDASGGFVGLTLFKINFKNALNTFTSFFTNSNTAARTYTFQDRDGTIADGTDLALKANIASPTFTGAPAAPTAAPGTNTTQLATCAFALNAASSFPSGTRMTFNQTAAPTGWTKDTTAALNDSIMRIVTGTVGAGGSTAFSTFNGQTSVGATTLALSQIPSHQHTGVQQRNINSNMSGGSMIGHQADYNTGRTATGLNSWENIGTQPQRVPAEGGGGSHTHTMTTAIKYNDFIIASKN